MEHPKLNIIYRSYGIADRFSDGTIELNRALDDYPGLKQSILRHEIRHTNNNRFNKKDFIHDLSTPDQVSLGKMLKFMFKHPASLVQFLPLYKTKTRGWVMDINLIIIYSILALISGLVVWFGFLI